MVKGILKMAYRRINREAGEEKKLLEKCYLYELKDHIRIKGVYKLKKKKILQLMIDDECFMCFYKENIIEREIYFIMDYEDGPEYDELWGSETSMY